ncbi:hypothetical protein LGH70_11340 [Hymenobacter sp. BT635]|uniref:SMI1/KNR4 family protein n=1 Tax=Hymenobacter nitidus TaxID=2880929 RepID=A0ABS8AD08_9BACT|nr:hypothetical protein [Hymenobacter nitidus]MCB2378181.1 hypothetical protein [Hymenobacter nitidus]
MNTIEELIGLHPFAFLGNLEIYCFVDKSQMTEAEMINFVKSNASYFQCISLDFWDYDKRIEYRDFAYLDSEEKTYPYMVEYEVNGIDIEIICRSDGYVFMAYEWPKKPMLLLDSLAEFFGDYCRGKEVDAVVGFELLFDEDSAVGDMIKEYSTFPLYAIHLADDITIVKHKNEIDTEYDKLDKVYDIVADKLVKIFR